MLIAENLTPEQTAAAKIRNIDNCKDIAPNYFEVWESWDHVKNGKLRQFKAKIRENDSPGTAPDHYKQYPVNWIKGNNLIFEVQTDYYQNETEEGDKLQGYCRRLIFYTGSKYDASQIAQGTHPKKLGYELLPLLF